MLVVEQLVAFRDGGPVFCPVRIEAQPGQLVEITGQNGAGKTTLLRTLAGLHGQYEGEFSVGSICYQGHRIGLDESLNAYQNLRWYAALSGQSLRDDEVSDALRQVNAFSLALTPVGRLSQGQQRRVAMARWLLSEADVWLLDEPLTALDTRGQQQLISLLTGALNRGTSVVCATHTPLDVANKVLVDIRAAEVSE